MGKSWDIIPPYRPKRRTKHLSKPQRRKNTSAFLSLIVVIFTIAFLYLAFKNTPPNVDGANTVTSQNPVINTPVTLSPSASPTQKTKDKLLIKILNGTGRSEETTSVSQILKMLNFPVTKTESALNLYDQTIVYFEPSQEKYAQEIAQNLEKYQAKTQEFSQESPYDIIIVIGTS